LQPYNYILLKPDHYTFTTLAGGEYDCYFYTAEEIFADYPSLAKKAFGFNIVLKNKPSIQKGLDKRIAATVITILKTFLYEKKNAVIYICDNSDGREKARFHKFSHWFHLYNEGSIIQLRGVVRAGGTNILNAMLIHKDNKYLNDFIEAYEILTGIYTKPDDEELQNILNDPEW
jgi:Family of unknown function (DUF6169)